MLGDMFAHQDDAKKLPEDEESKAVENQDAPKFQNEEGAKVNDTQQKLNQEDGIELAEKKEDANEGGQKEEVIDFTVADNLKLQANRSETRPAASKVAVNARQETEPGANEDF